MKIVIISLFSLFFVCRYNQFFGDGCSAMTLMEADDLPSTTEIAKINSGAISDGTKVRVEGRFLGWSGCKDPRAIMLTRSDWGIEDATGCIMVSGPLPDGFRPQKKGGHVVVEGIVKVIAGKNGRIGVVIQAVRTYIKNAIP